MLGLTGAGFRRILFCLLILLAAGGPLTAGPTLALTETPPARQPDNLIVASYNIKWLGKSPHDYDKLAQVLQHFDICGVIELQGESALAELTRRLGTLTGTKWGYAYGFRTHRQKGTYHEAYGVIWNKSRVELGDGLISNLPDYGETFRHDPFFVNFSAGNTKFILALIHTRWTDDDEGTRKAEVAGIAEQIQEARSFLDEDKILLAGDFNYSATHADMKPLTAGGELLHLDTNDNSTLGSSVDYSSPYDHFYATESAAAMIDTTIKSQALDVTKLVYGERTAATMKKSKTDLSDHIPVFVVLKR